MQTIQAFIVSFLSLFGVQQPNTNHQQIVFTQTNQQYFVTPARKQTNLIGVNNRR